MLALESTLGAPTVAQSETLRPCDILPQVHRHLLTHETLMQFALLLAGTKLGPGVLRAALLFASVTLASCQHSPPSTSVATVSTEAAVQDGPPETSASPPADGQLIEET